LLNFIILNLNRDDVLKESNTLYIQEDWKLSYMFNCFACVRDYFKSSYLFSYYIL